jgi:hypothetical protein
MGYNMYVSFIKKRSGGFDSPECYTVSKRGAPEQCDFLCPKNTAAGACIRIVNIAHPGHNYNA